MINEVVTKFSFIGSLKPQESFNANLGGSIKLMAGMVAGLAAATAGMFAWTSSVNQSLKPVIDLQKEIRVAAGVMQELGYAASQNGSDLDAVTSSLKSINDKVAEFERFGTGSAAEAASYLGISFRDASGHMKKADVIMEDLRRSMQGMGDAERLELMSKLGIDATLLRTMRLSGTEMDRLRKRARELGVVSGEQAEAVNDYNNALLDQKFAMNSLNQMVAISFAPMMQEMADGFVDLLSKNRDFIIGGLKWLGEVLIATFGAMRRLAPIMAVVAGSFLLAQVATMGFGAALGVVFSPVLLIASAIAAVILIIDDLLVMMTGGQSVIGDFFQEFLGVDLVLVIADAVDAIAGIFPKIKALWGDMTAWLKAQALDILPTWAVKLISGGVDMAGGIADNFIGNASSVLDRVTGGGSQSSNTEQNVQQNIYTSDPVQAGKVAADSLNAQLQDAKMMSSRGGK